jgi:hypothetical protein
LARQRQPDEGSTVDDRTPGAPGIGAGGGRAALLAAPAYLLVALAATWPAVTAPSRWVIGHPNGDLWTNLWGYHWVRGELLAGRFPVEVTQISHPAGGQLYFTDLTDALLAVPLLGLFSLPTTYNLLVWFNLTLAAVAAFALARHLTASSLGSFLAGLVYGFSPYLLGNVASGVSETVSAGWFPLAMLAVLRTGETGRWRDALAAGLLLAITAMGCLYYGIVAGIVATMLVLYGLLARRPRWTLRERAAPLALAALISMAIFGPLYLAVNRTLTDGNDFEARPLVLPRAYPVNWRQASPVTDLANLLSPGKLTTAADGVKSENTVFHVTYVGFAVLALLVAGLLPGRRPPPRGTLDARRERAFWLGTAFLLGALSMGEYPVIAGEEARIAGLRLILPGALLAKVLPVAALGQHTFRYFVVVVLCLAMLGAGGWRRLVLRLPGRGLRVLATAGVAVLLAAETLWISPMPLPVPAANAVVPDFYRELAGDTADYAVLDLPFHHENWVHERYLYYAAIHGKRTPYTFNATATDEVRFLPIVQELQDWTMEKRSDVSLADRGGLTPAPLLDMGFELLVVHRGLMAGVLQKPLAEKRILAALVDRFGEPQHADPQVVVFSLRGEGEARGSSNPESGPPRGASQGPALPRPPSTRLTDL